MICCLSVALSQAQKEIAPPNSRGKTSAEALRAYGIDLSEPSLLTALSNSNPKVRVLAAYQLAAEHDSGATSAIEGALSREKDTISRVGLATALASMHDAVGEEYLQAACADPTSPINAVIAAVQMLKILSLPGGGCADNVLHSLDRPADKDYLNVTVTLFPLIYKQVSSDKESYILTRIQQLLLDKTKEPAVRLAAGDALAQIGDPSSIEAVRAALSQEDDPTIRSSLEMNLNVLEKKQQSLDAKNP